MAFVFKIDSTASSNAPSKANSGVPCPSPGSITPKKNSALVIVIVLLVDELVPVKIVFLKSGPQLFELSFKRILIRVGELLLVIVWVLAKILSVTSSHSPSTTEKETPDPTPGSTVPIKYSPDLTSGWAKTAN